MVVLGIFLVIMAGISKAVMDNLNFHFHTSIFKNRPTWYWNMEFSYLNKYQNQDPTKGPKFFGSTTFLVWTTDAWHLFQMVRQLSLTIGVFILGNNVDRMWLSILCWMGLYLLYTTTFEIFYSKIFRK
jgi:hypothetical protein